MKSIEGEFKNLQKYLSLLFVGGEAQRVETRRWQALDVTDRPEMTPHELTDVTLGIDLDQDRDTWMETVQPNLPWAEIHFQERVSGIPHNPPPSHEYWPHAQANNEEFKATGKFSHTYPERFWPKFANAGELRPNGRQVFVPHNGIRFEYGDLMNVVRLIYDDPYTRQAYLPIFFPEDTGAHHKERIPCTLGYLFRYRGTTLDIVYYIRSCDFRRHFPDDVYMAGRLAQWMGEMLRDTREQLKVEMGQLVMHIGSLHVFEGDLPLMKAERAAQLGSVW